VEIKKSEWIAKLEKLGVSVDVEDLEQKEALGEIQPYERELINDYDSLSQKIELLLENKEGAAHKDGAAAASLLLETVSSAATNTLN
jgi:hypothetical protein